MKYELNFRNNKGTDRELLDDMKMVAFKLGKDKMTKNEYDQLGKFSSATIYKRFGSWNNALEKAGLKITNTPNSWEKELFENLENVWIQLGRQTRKRDLIPPISKFSVTRYKNKFGSYKNALEAFIEFINSEGDEQEELITEENISESTIKIEHEYKHKTKRQPSERLKVQVLMRDGNRCKLCGITLTGENIHFDHITPWSKGGETTLENLQILCAPHNLVKGDLDFPRQL